MSSRDQTIAYSVAIASARIPLGKSMNLLFYSQKKSWEFMDNGIKETMKSHHYLKRHDIKKEIEGEKS